MVARAKFLEPSFTEKMTSSQVMDSLNWYHENKENKDAQKYLSDFAKKFKIKGKLNTGKSYLTLAWLCRLKLNGNDTGYDDEYFRTELSKLFVEEKTIVVDTKETPTITIQDRIREKASECIGELEGLFDDFILSGCTANTSPYGLMHSFEIKSVHTRFIVEVFKKRRAQYDEALYTEDKEFREAYDMTKPQLKKVIAWCDQVILDCQKISGEAVKSRKPRKRKVKTAAEQTTKMKYCVEFPELKLKSIDPKLIVGALQLWVYNTKTRKLGCYHAEDAGGFTIKGTTIQNFSESKSTQKKLRKPEVTLKEVLDGGKIILKRLIDGIRAVESPLTGRINNDTVLVRVVK